MYINIKLFNFLFNYRLIKSQLTKHCRQVCICNTCLIHFHSETTLNKHKDECNKIVTRLHSVDNNIIRFKNFLNILNFTFCSLR